MLMKKALFAIACVGVIALCSDARAETLREIDMRENATGDLYVMFCARPIQPKSSSGDAIIVVGEGNPSSEESFTGIFGMYVNQGKQAVGKVPAARVTEVRGAGGPSETTTFIVHIDKELYQQVADIVETYSAQEKFPDNAQNVALNFGGEVVKTLGLKLPYRSGLGGANAPLYYKDAGVLNRKRGVR